MQHATFAACRRLMAGGSKSFAAASRLLPRRVAEPAAGLYAFCRVADDAVDASPDPAAALAQLRRRLDAIYAGTPGPAVADQAFAEVVATFELPRALPEALLEGFAWDAAGRRYETLRELLDYAARVAGSVGVMMAVLMETRERAALTHAGELGLAMQLTNIARDVGEDARAKPAPRLYLPRAWMADEGIDADAWLAKPRFDAALARVVERLLAEAERLYARAECGVAALPRDCRPGIQAARLVYAEIGHRLARAGHDSVSRRTVVPARRKLVLLAEAAGAALFAPGHPLDLRAEGGAERSHAALRFLVDAAASDERPARTIYQRTVRVLEIFDRAGQRRRQAAW